ncbi:hypothetical protein SAMN05421823_11413 [Catalinimonas alkaloidigena]|uniref:HD domain-containing protein n=2 Tax=Catalinimonas alkaloidigena TaxID=1075417 RepID=A0A1G9TH78_9BACT|nr:hypothetical protein SAMN05421823_11413 [Catalinimonas alkaloidigena]
MHPVHALPDTLLQRFRPMLGQDFARYRNHVHRVFSHCLLLDREESHAAKYAVAAVFHDLGIWTDHTFDYLAPSVQQARRYLTEHGHADWTEEITLMIYWHHKLIPYRGQHAPLVETFRRADWMDVTFGWVRFGVDRQQLRHVRRQWPNLGFHVFLVRETGKRLRRHPLHPLPMFRV